MTPDIPTPERLAQWALLIGEDAPQAVQDPMDAIHTLHVAIAMLMSDGTRPAKAFTLHAWEALRCLADRIAVQ